LPLSVFGGVLGSEISEDHNKHDRAVKWPVNQAEPMASGVSANRELPLVYPEVLMRSELVFGAMEHVSNRYLLTKLASKAARELHKPGARIEDTTNDVLVRFSRANPIGCEQALPDPLLVQLSPKMTRIIPQASEVVPLPPALENDFRTFLLYPGGASSGSGANI
jgi:hypothetical protein